MFYLRLLTMLNDTLIVFQNLMDQVEKLCLPSFQVKQFFVLLQITVIPINNLIHIEFSFKLKLLFKKDIIFLRILECFIEFSEIEFFFKNRPTTIYNIHTWNLKRV